jgi:transposase
LREIPNSKYTKEFREEAVKLVFDEKLTLAEAARRLSLPESTLTTWVRIYKSGKLSDIGKTFRPLTEVEMELARVKKENATLKMENEILKKAAAYFARSRCPVRDDEKAATQLPSPDDEPVAGCILQWVLCMVKQAAIQVGMPGGPAGTGDQSG